MAGILPISQNPFLLHIENQMLSSAGVDLWMRREDVIHSEVSGNKWRKLRYNLTCIREGQHLVTFGGAYSNHISATAAAGKILGIPCHGIIRGERATELSPTLRYAESCGMQLHFVSRTDYKDKSRLPAQIFGGEDNLFILPEGGTNELALKGVAEIMDDEMKEMDVVCCPVGTGGTLAGLVSAGSSVSFLGFSALKADLAHDVSKLLSSQACVSQYNLVNEYHFGGYARTTDSLMDFIKDFMRNHGVLLDPVYTGKMMYGLFDLISKGHFPEGTKICAIHTGGLQGWGGFKQRFGIEPPSAE